VSGGSAAADGATAGRRAVLAAPAKVNLHLEILRRRHDGYHDIETILQAVSLFDTVTVERFEDSTRGKPRIELRVRPGGSAPADRHNLCWQAARLFCQETGCSGRVRIDLSKDIPSAAGLGGGSSDAAAVLVACDRLFETGLATEQLEALAARIGSDAPFFIRGGTMLARGRGTRLTVLPTIRRGYFLLIKPPIDLMARDVYEGLKMGLTGHVPVANIQNVKALIARFPGTSWFGFNRLEEVVLPAHPALQRLILHLKEIAPVAMLSGSGAAVVAVFANENELPKISEFAQEGWFVRVVGPHAGGVTFMEE
jgi:4-diphosphocytidyl-2-C-methyl-D-erythritol kinase